MFGGKISENKKFKKKYKKYKNKYIRLGLSRALTDKPEEQIVVPMAEELHKLMPKFSIDLLDIINFLESGWINFSVEHKGRDVPVDFNKFIEHMLSLIDLILDKKLKIDNDIFQMLLEEIPSTTKQEIEWLDMLKEEIISLYKDKSMSRKKFRKYIKEFINRMLDNEYIILKKYGLTT